MHATYWDNEGATKIFTHELSETWLKDFPRQTPVLDFGCGYGRISKQLQDMGFDSVIGYDPSHTMVSRAVTENNGPVYTSEIEDLKEHHYGLVICFALFTSSPEPERQRAIQMVIEEQTRKNSCLYISDYLTSENPHYLKRYQQKQLGIYGCFGSKETAIFRHHEPGHFSKLFFKWSQTRVRTIAGKTLNGNPINMTQLFYEKG